MTGAAHRAIAPRAGSPLGVLLALLTASALSLATAGSASAAASCSTCHTWWHVSTASLPAELPPGGEGKLTVIAEDLGSAAPSGTVVLRDRLPEGLTATSVALGIGENRSVLPEFGEALCTVSSHEVTCTIAQPYAAIFLNRPFVHVEAYINVTVAQTAASGEQNQASVSGGGAPAATAERPLTFGTGATPFGVEQYELTPETAEGTVDTQAGSHPFQLTTTASLDQTANIQKPPASVKDLRFNLPPGLIGNPTPFPQCPLTKFLTTVENAQNLCPDDTVVGIASVSIDFPASGAPATVTVPLFALVPSRGEPARFGFLAAGEPVYLDASVRTGSDYGVTVTVANITETAGLISSRVTFWGVPGDPRHDAVRGWNCISPNEGAPPCEPTNLLTPPPLLALPTACAGFVQSDVEADSWQEEGAFRPPVQYTMRDNLGRPAAMTGCNQLPFSPSIRVTPDGQAGSSPTGLTVDEHVPQETSLNPAGLAESDVKGLSVTLPEGVALNPAAGDGLQSCDSSAIGLTTAEVVGCPESSKIATVTIKTPLLPDPLEGAAYLAVQNANPFGSLVAMYLYAEDPKAGVRLKVAGEVVADPSTGQLTAHFEQDPALSGAASPTPDPQAEYLPQLPFEDVALHFFGGARAPLATPARCGTYTATGTFTPWSETATVGSSGQFQITSGPNGLPCPGASLPFSPSLTGGSTSIDAGGFSPLTTTISRGDGQQNMQSVSLHMPPGLEGVLTGVALCGEAQANEGTCGPASLIGETTVAAGVGSDPVLVKGGRVYLTGPHDGAPFGLSIVNPVKAGPFDLEHDTANPAQQPACDCLVVRARIDVDPRTAALTITTDPSGPHAIPQIVDGIPVQIQKLNVTVNRPNFTFNPTDCEPLAITGALTGFEGASDPLSAPFQVTNCASLKFSPAIQVATRARSSRADGAALSFRIAYPKGAQGAQSWFNEARFELPRQLSARLTTIQHACLQHVYETSRAACPAASRIGTAVVHTPILPVPLEGQVYFVSYGGAKFPEAVMDLYGYGVHVELHGETFINGKTNITSATFRNTPDVPFESIEVTLPQGRYSEFAANLPHEGQNFCGQKLVMPTLLKAQNGLEIHQNTPIQVTGCPKAKPSRAQLLAAAMKACHKQHNRHRRAACEASAHRKYGPRTANNHHKH